MFRSFRFGVIIAVCFFAIAPAAWGFCGFYVAKADAQLYNQASRVIIARNGDRTVLTMANDYRGDVKDFALVVPVPTLLSEDQVHVGEPEIIDRLDSFSAPRLVEYFDANPCETRRFRALPQTAETSAVGDAARLRGGNALGVTVEAQFSVGEYDILILSAEESQGLETWLRQNDYKLPANASRLLQPYIRQNLKFFVARVNLEEYESGGFQSLRPLMIAYESPRFMLPIRLGTLNATGEQDLIVYLLSPRGEVELTNYRTVKIPSDVEIPEFVKAEFPDFYKSMFQTAYQRENKRVAFLEYAWDMGSCDPCSAPVLSPEELRQAGVFWTDGGRANKVFITRLHLRYTRNTFPEDLRFQETSNRQFFQGRYIIRHPYTGNLNCSAAEDYRRTVRERQEREADNLARLTGWEISKIRDRVNFIDVEARPWWNRLWN